MPPNLVTVNNIMTRVVKVLGHSVKCSAFESESGLVGNSTFALTSSISG
jgi:hypothetical protein